MAYLNILKTNVKKINEEEFTRWLDSKNKAWWSKYGLCMTGENSEQDDEVDVRSWIPQKIKEFNEHQMIDNEDDIGCLLALCSMISEYLKEKCGAKEENLIELNNDTHVLLVRE